LAWTAAQEACDAANAGLCSTVSCVMRGYRSASV
jgi:hypothetical protein